MFNSQVVADAKHHALDQYPNEACGVVVEGEYIPQPNVHVEPRNFFKLPPIDLKYVQAIIHSHTDEMPWPSAKDMEEQALSKKPWGLLATDGENTTELNWFGDGVPVPPLKGREFIPGILDCYSMLRDYYSLNLDISLMDFPRDPEWWERGNNLLSRENFTLAGFQQISREDVKEHDVILYSISSNVANHCAVYVGNNRIIHHLANRLSKEDAASRWTKFEEYVLRYDR